MGGKVHKTTNRIFSASFADAMRFFRKFITTGYPFSLQLEDTIYMN